jgi:hypothetical protein
MIAQASAYETAESAQELRVTASLTPKRRHKFDQPALQLAVVDVTSEACQLSRKPRMKRSGRPHQVWTAPSRELELDPKLPSAPMFHEILGLFKEGVSAPDLFPLPQLIGLDRYPKTLAGFGNLVVFRPRPRLEFCQAKIS